ncbi:AAA family ATPase [Spiroplasma endosymbiont of Eupeodes luniger]|uniref:AAA family ATPase n=1 Tax=Spiroplasma endosymbiont of Eupeodes luniger TaxID=3066300 RepID=UPI0030D28BCC
MVFLKRLEAYGFKSFAKPTKIVFEHGIIGVVGPNGSGKSNINDAIRWVLGEQSIKSLRGDNIQDIIFQGSSEYPQLNMAEVKLIFNNKKRIFPIDFDEVEITRRVYRDNNENEYSINKSRSRLKDVQELVLGTGLSKGSLAIINQGNVANFSQVKPEERRLLFEEAANVSKYKKRKLESVRKLEKTEENLVRINDIIIEMERNINYLRRQAKKAQEYVTKKEQLTTIEVAILVKDITSQYEGIRDLQLEIKRYTSQTEDLSVQITNYDNKINLLQENIFTIDNKMQQFGQQLDEHLNQLELLQNEKISQQNEKQVNSNNQVQDLEQDANNINQEILQQTKLITEQQNMIDDFQKKRILLNEDLEVAVKKYNLLNKEIYELKSKQDYLVDLQSNNTYYYQGVKTILNNRLHLTGIIDTIDRLINVPSIYQLAIQEALSSSMQHIVVEKDSDAIRAIQFLKANEGGIATFLPLNSLRIQMINNEDLSLLKTQKGFIGIAYELLTTNVKFEPVMRFLLGRIIIVESLAQANEIAHFTYRKYHIITLQGDVIRPGGSISGGHKRVKSFLFNNEEQVNSLKTKISELEQLVQTYYQKWQSIKEKLITLNNELEQKQLHLGKFQQSKQSNEQKQRIIEQEYQHLTKKKMRVSDDFNQQLDERLILENKISNLKLEKLKITEQQQTQRALRETYSNQLYSLTLEIKKMRTEYKNQEKLLQEYNYQKLAIDNCLQQNLERLAQEYRLTYEYGYEKYGQDPIGDIKEVREQIILLRQELQDLGPVNIDAISEYETINERYQFLKEQEQELNNGKKQLLNAIKDMDEIMITRFNATIKDINKVLPETFKVLFAGGTASLVYTDPNNILETGIDILVNLPGKTITNLNLLSGGEKSLVALAVLFAILKARPLPIVILDEVEAPLDVANVERFAKYLKSFATETQFIVITHRPGTMENCDTLYGTTMQSKGVTKMVAIRLEQAKNLVTSAN